MSAYELEKDQGVYTLNMIAHEQDNTFTTDALLEFHRILDALENTDEDACLLITSHHEKTFSTGINLHWIVKQDAEQQKEFVHLLDNLLLRIATFNMPTVAAINGNAYAGGALLAAACDFRYMRADRGRFCFSEVKIKKAFSPAMIEVVKLLPNQHAAYELSITADAWGGDRCEAESIVDKALPIEQLHNTAKERAVELASKHRPTLTAIKRDLRSSATAMAIERGVIEKLKRPSGIF